MLDAMHVRVGSVQLTIVQAAVEHREDQSKTKRGEKNKTAANGRQDTLFLSHRRTQLI